MRLPTERHNLGEASNTSAHDAEKQVTGGVRSGPVNEMQQMQYLLKRRAELEQQKKGRRTLTNQFHK